MSAGGWACSMSAARLLLVALPRRIRRPPRPQCRRCLHRTHRRRRRLHRHLRRSWRRSRVQQQERHVQEVARRFRAMLARPPCLLPELLRVLLRVLQAGVPMRRRKR